MEHFFPTFQNSYGHFFLLLPLSYIFGFGVQLCNVLLTFLLEKCLVSSLNQLPFPKIKERIQNFASKNHNLQNINSNATNIFWYILLYTIEEEKKPVEIVENILSDWLTNFIFIFRNRNTFSCISKRKRRFIFLGYWLYY